jgi:hypothetical protein
MAAAATNNVTALNEASSRMTTMMPSFCVPFLFEIERTVNRKRYVS